MNRITVAMLAALEAVIVVAIGLGIALVPLTILWAAQYHMALDWAVFWRAASDVWLAGHGVDLSITLPATFTDTLGLPGSAAPFPVTIAALGFAMLAVLLGVRTGVRAAATPFRITGIVTAVVVYAILALVIVATGGSAIVHPSLWQGVLLPTLVFGGGVLIGAEFGGPRTDDAVGRGLRSLLERLTPAVRAGAETALRAGTAAAAAVVGVAAIVIAVLLLANFSAVVGLYEQLQAGGLGGAVLTLAQLAFLPNLVIWAAAWLIGPGFAIGTGSSVGPLGTQLGPIPSIPILGVLPDGQLALGFLGLLVPVLVGFLAAVVVRQRRLPFDRPTQPWPYLTGAGIGVVAGIELGLLAWWSGGALGPGRLHDVGPNPWMVGAFAALEIAVAAIIGLLVPVRAPARLSVTE